MTLLAEGEKEFLARLEGIKENPADDVWAYEFVLEDAIDITRDSMELALEDLGERARRIVEAEVEEEKERRTMMTPERRKEVEQVKEQEAKKEAEDKGKRPTLLKRGRNSASPESRASGASFSAAHNRAPNASEGSSTTRRLRGSGLVIGRDPSVT